LTRHPRADAGGRRVLISFSCEPGSELLEFAHRFVAAFTRLRFRPVLAQRVTLAAYELLANALAYSSVSREVDFELVDAGGALEVRVSNEAVPSRLAMLGERVQRLGSDAEGVYLEEMRRSAAGMRATLGLARVRWEAECTLEVVRSEGVVTVVARTPK